MIFSLGNSCCKSIYSKLLKDWLIKKSKISSEKFGFKLRICKVNNKPYTFDVSYVSCTNEKLFFIIFNISLNNSVWSKGSSEIFFCIFNKKVETKLNVILLVDCSLSKINFIFFKTNALLSLIPFKAFM